MREPQPEWESLPRRRSTNTGTAWDPTTSDRNASPLAARRLVPGSSVSAVPALLERSGLDGAHGTEHAEHEVTRRRYEIDSVLQLWSPCRRVKSVAGGGVLMNDVVKAHL
jgi:hypothetical protein